MTQYKLRLTGNQCDSLYSHLFPGDGLEAISIGLCGVSTLTNDNDTKDHVITVHKIRHIAYEDCTHRSEKKVQWSTEQLTDLLEEALEKKLIVMKIHSHPGGGEKFSPFDDESDIAFFDGVSGWLQTDFPGISAIMLTNGKIIARAFDDVGNTSKVDSVLVAGHEINVWYPEENVEQVSDNAISLRTEQAFGKGTTALLSKLTVGVVGVSGTGSPVTEMLYRLGVGKLVLIDDDIVEEKNVGRIYNSSLEDAKLGRHKVEVIEQAVRDSGLPTIVKSIKKNLFHPEVVREVAQCDLVFGCMDSIDGRDLLNKISIYYSLPYFDLGVYLEADGLGSVDVVSGAVQYVTPDTSTLLDRKAYTSADLQTSHLKRTKPELYSERLKEGYIKGINEERPAVISVNTLIASLAINEFLARVHPFRYFENNQVTVVRFNLSDLSIDPQPDQHAPCPILSKEIGRGDATSLLQSID